MPDERKSWLDRIVVLATGHLVMLAVLGLILDLIEPDPSGFRLSSPESLIWFGALTAVGPLLGLFCVSLRATVAVASIQAFSPLALLPTALDQEADLSFAVLLWWGPVPAVVLAVVVADRRFSSRGG